MNRTAIVMAAGLLIATTATAADRPHLAISRPGAHAERVMGSYLYEMYLERRKARRALALDLRRQLHSRRPPAVYYLGRPSWPRRAPDYPIRSPYLQAYR